MNDKPVDILLVDDNPNDVELTLHALKKNGFEGLIHIARDGAEALEYLFGTGAYSERRQASAPRLILLDLKLPKVTGLEVLKRIKGDERTQTIPVIALTTSRESRDIQGSYMLGVNSYIVKPVDFQEFSEAMSMVARYWFSLNQLPL
jgi:two-component system, response regulator